MIKKLLLVSFLPFCFLQAQFLLGSENAFSVLAGHESFTSDKRIELYQNYPNPAKKFTVIKYRVPEGSRVTIIVYNILGKSVMNSSSNFITFNGTNSVTVDVSHLPTGIYFYELIVPGMAKKMKKMMVIN